jgi:A/G-specific adenine glycosylase
VALPRNFFVEWFKHSGRDFPWRKTDTSPFAFLITEILLRQTGAKAVAKLWEGFTRTYPDPGSLLRARRRTLFARVKVLGFGNQRAEALHAAAKYLIDHHDGQVPKSLDALLKVPHVGNYTARAILCFAFGEKAEIVDTNILRFFARYYGLTVRPDIRRNRVVWEIAKQSMPREKRKARDHNFGLLDFTAEICKALQPRCAVCPLRTSCVIGRKRLATL